MSNNKVMYDNPYENRKKIPKKRRYRDEVDKFNSGLGGYGEFYFD